MIDEKRGMKIKRVYRLRIENSATKIHRKFLSQHCFTISIKIFHVPKNVRSATFQTVASSYRCAVKKRFTIQVTLFLHFPD